MIEASEMLSATVQLEFILKKHSTNANVKTLQDYQNDYQNNLGG
jgi:hypothetical protein